MGGGISSPQDPSKTEKDLGVGHVDFPRPCHLHVFLQEMRGLGHAGQQGAAAVRAAVPVAGPGAVLPLPRPRRGAPAAPAQGGPARRLRGRPGRPAFHRLLLGQVPAWDGKHRAARVQEGGWHSRRSNECASCLKTRGGVAPVPMLSEGRRPAPSLVVLVVCFKKRLTVPRHSEQGLGGVCSMQCWLSRDFMKLRDCEC